MKKEYIKPEIEVVEVELESMFLADSYDEIPEVDKVEPWSNKRRNTWGRLTNMRRGTWGNLWADGD